MFEMPEYDTASFDRTRNALLVTARPGPRHGQSRAARVFKLVKRSESRSTKPTHALSPTELTWC